jgi:hypothetical protein
MKRYRKIWYALYYSDSCRDWRHKMYLRRYTKFRKNYVSTCRHEGWVECDCYENALYYGTRSIWQRINDKTPTLRWNSENKTLFHLCGPNLSKTPRNYVGPAWSIFVWFIAPRSEWSFKIIKDGRVLWIYAGMTIITYQGE